MLQIMILHPSPILNLEVIDMVKKPKKKLSGLDAYVIFSITMMLLYTITSQIIAVTTSNTLDTLTTCFFGFFGGEIVTCALIKIFKLRKEKETHERDNLYDS
jgi:hypothetical protein